MSVKIKLESGELITLTDKDYKTSGGQAKIYVKGSKVYKIYFDPQKTMLPPAKIRELSAIKNSSVIIPNDIVYHYKNDEPLGYVTQYVDQADPLVLFLTKTHKVDNRISPKMIAECVKQMQLITAEIHKSNCLIVDYNELNILIKKIGKDLFPFYIDTDSYATPSYPSVAIMSSIRDRKATIYGSNGNIGYKPTILSDWFSFAVLTFWFYSNIHPYRGSHPDYSNRDKEKQMDDGISIFHPKVKYPPALVDINTIPKRHLAWYKDIFLNGNRSIPPLPDSSQPLDVPKQISIVKGTDKLNVIEVSTYSEKILSVMEWLGVTYVITEKSVYSNENKESNLQNIQKALVCPIEGSTPVLATLKGNQVTFSDLNQKNILGTARAEGATMFQRNRSIYTVSSGKLVEHNFISFGGKQILSSVKLENILELSSQMYDGCIIQDLLGNKHVVFPYEKGKCFSKHFPELDSYRIISAKADNNVIIIVGEKKGKYDRFIIVFKRDYSTHYLRIDKDISYDSINFAVLDNNLCMLLSNPNEIELFFKPDSFETIINPPFDSSMSLFSAGGKFFFINDNSIHQLKKK